MLGYDAFEAHLTGDSEQVGAIVVGRVDPPGSGVPIEAEGDGSGPALLPGLPHEVCAVESQQVEGDKSGGEATDPELWPIGIGEAGAEPFEGGAPIRFRADDLTVKEHLPPCEDVRQAGQLGERIPVVPDRGGWSL